MKEFWVVRRLSDGMYLSLNDGPTSCSTPALALRLVRKEDARRVASYFSTDRNPWQETKETNHD